MSFARRYRMMIEAQEAATSAQENDNAQMTGSAYELNLDLLAQQKRQLKNCKSILSKIELKKSLLPEWDGYIDGILTADAGVQDQIIGQLLVWHIDVGNYDTALKIGEYMLKHHLALPEHFERDLEDAFAEEMANAWIKVNPRTITLSQLEQTLALVENVDMHDEVRAKLLRSLGEGYFEEDDLTNAYQHLSEAVHFNPNVGCKPLLQKVEKALNRN